MIFLYKTTPFKKKLLFKHKISNDFMFFIFLIKEFLKLKNIYTHNILKLSIFLLNLFSIKFLFFIRHINIYITILYKKNIFFQIYSIEICYWKNKKYIDSFLQLKKISQKILLIKKISRTRAKGRVKRYKVVLILGNKSGWFGLGYNKDYYIQEAISKARLNAFKNIYIISILYSNLLNNIMHIQSKSKRLYLFFSKYNRIISKNYVIRILFDFVGLTNIKSKLIRYNNIYNILKILLKKI